MDDPVAIVGMACRFAGASSPDEFWKMIEDGRTGHSRIPKRSFDADAWYHPSRQRLGAICTKSGFFIDDVSSFDAPFFSMTAREAAAMDPMQRLALEISYEGFENAGWPMQKLSKSRTAVYCGVMTADYQEIAEGDMLYLGDHAATGTNRAILSNRISWFFDLKGPSLTLDTACSSGLYGLHLACQAIKANECDQALIIGTNLILHPNLVAQYSSMNMISPDGKSHSFDASANGYGRGEGVACVVLKRLPDAIRDNDCIRAVVRGTGVNHSGKTTSITMPSETAQMELIYSTYQNARLPLADTSYFEAHGTGTPQGDPIEIRAIAKTIGAARKAKGALYVGSVKPNIGHTEGVAGIAGVIKVILSLEAGTIPAVAGLETVNPDLHLSQSNLELPTENIRWPDPGLRRASVNSFGFGGANAHAILENYLDYLAAQCPLGLSSNRLQPVETRSPPSGNYHLQGSFQQHHVFALSARERIGITRVASSYAAYLASRPRSIHEDLIGMQTLSHILGTRRSQLDFCSYVVTDSWTGLLEALGKPQTLPVERVSPKNKVVFVFTGQGAQRPGMAKELLSYSVFRNSIKQSQQVLDDCGALWRISDLLTSTDTELIGIPQYSQPLSTAIQVALVELLSSWGIEPAAVLGHSSGEIAAAFAAGVLSSREAIHIAYFRGSLSTIVPFRVGEGIMLAAGMSESEAEMYLSDAGYAGSVTIACINSPSSVTLSGAKAAITAVHEALVRDGKFSRILRTGVAYHSPHMAAIAPDLEKMLACLPQRTLAPQIPMYSSVDEEMVSSEGLSKDYWLENMLQPVRFAGALRNLITASGKQGTQNTEYSTILEIGPSSTLKGPINQILATISHRMTQQLPYRSVLKAGQHACQAAVEAAGFLWATGHPVRLDCVNAIRTENVALDLLPHLPSYVWNHENSFWHETTASRAVRLRSQPRSDLLGLPVDGQNRFEPRWRNIISISENPWLADHNVADTCLYPAAGYLVMALEAVRSLTVESSTLQGVEFTDVTFEAGLALPEYGRGEEISLTLYPHAVIKDAFNFSVYSHPTGQSVRRHVHGSVAAVYCGDQPDQVEEEAQKQEWSYSRALLEESQELATEKINVLEFYSQLASAGLKYGPTFRSLQSLRALSGCNIACGKLSIPDTKSVMPKEFEYPHLIHPATLDCAFHLAFAASQTKQKIQHLTVPVSVGRLFISTDMPAGPGSTLLGRSSAQHMDKGILADILFTDSALSGPRIVVESMKMEDVDKASLASEKPGPPRRSAEIVWKEDVTHFRAQNLNSQEWLSSWLECLWHKNSQANVLIIGAESLSSLDVSGSPDQCTMLGMNENGQVFDFSDGPVTSTKPDSFFKFNMETRAIYDAVIYDAGLSANTEWLPETMLRIVKPGGSIIMFRGDGSSFNFLNNTWLDTLIESKQYHLVRNSIPQSLCVATASPVTPTCLGDAPDSWKFEGITILEHEISRQTSFQIEFRECLTRLLVDAGFSVRVVQWTKCALLHGQRVISLLECGESLFYNLLQSDMMRFREFIASAPGYILWVTTGGPPTPGFTAVKHAPTTGLLRTLRTENPLLRLPQLDLSEETIRGAVFEAASIVINVLCSTLDTSPMETEFSEARGKLFIPRLVDNKAFDAELELYQYRSTSLPMRLDESQKALRLNVGRLGLVQWVLVPTTGTMEIKADQVTVTTRHATIIHSPGNTGHVSEKRLFQSWMLAEIIGIVDRVGQNVAGIHPGDLVLFESTDMRTRIIRNASEFLKIPSKISSLQAAHWIGPLAISYLLLLDSVRTQSQPADGNEKSLSDTTRVLGECWPVGCNLLHGDRPVRSILIDVQDLPLRYMLVKMAQYLQLDISVIVPPGEATKKKSSWFAGCRILTTMSRAISKMVFKNNTHGGIDLVFSSLDRMSIVPHILTSMSPRGEFVAVDAVYGQEKALRSLSPRSDIAVGCIDTSKLHGPRFRKAQIVVLQLLANGTILLPPDLPERIVQPVSNIELVLKSPPYPSHNYRHIISFQRSCLIPVQFSKPIPAQLAAGGTYILSGGLGTLGLKIASWLVNDHGAHHLVFLSRSGIPSSVSASALDSLIEKGCRCDVIGCDITSAQEVERLRSRITQNGWNVRGIIQGAMVLADSAFGTMTAEKWETASAPKIRGSWNLHQILGQNLDFFLLLSSISGVIGNSGQANYSAGNTFEDALAAHRRGLGLPAISLNLGLVTDSETVNNVQGTSNVKGFLEKFTHLAPVVVSILEVQAALAAAIRGRSLNGAALPSQVVVGISDRLRQEALGNSAPSHWQLDPKFEHRVDRRVASPTMNVDKPDYAGLIRVAVSTEDARGVIENALRTKLASAISTKAENVDTEKPITAYGIDSLKATEVRNWVLKEFESQLSIFDILSPAPISQLASLILKKSFLKDSFTKTTE